MTTTNPTAKMLADALDASDLTQKDVAIRAGFKNANVLSMMKTGETNVPLVRIPTLASVLGLDVQVFLMTAIEEYYLPVHEVLVDILGLPLTDEEMDAVARARMKELDDAATEVKAKSWKIESNFTMRIMQE